MNHLNLKYPKIYNLLDLLGADSSGKFTLCSIFEHRIDGIYADLLLNAYWLSMVFHGLAGSEIADVAKNKLLTIKTHKKKRILQRIVIRNQKQSKREAEGFNPIQIVGDCLAAYLNPLAQRKHAENPPTWAIFINAWQEG